MGDYSPPEIVRMLMVLGECAGNYRETSRRYAARYPNDRHPNPNTIKSLKFRAENGHVCYNFGGEGVHHTRKIKK